MAVAIFCQLANNIAMANRIREVRKSKGMTLEELSELTGISTSFLSRIEKGGDAKDGRGLSLENAARIARALATEIEEISNDFGADDIAAASRLDFAPRPNASGDVANLNIRGGLGLGSVEDAFGDVGDHFGDRPTIYTDHVNGFWSFPDAVKAGWRNMPQVYSIPVTGDSMEPTLSSGSYVFVDMTHTDPTPEDIYACDYGDGLAIKRLQKIPRTDRIKVMSDNDRYDDYELRREDVRVYGRVVAWFQWRG